MNKIHEKALEVATRFKQAEADLISVLQEVEMARVRDLESQRTAMPVSIEETLDVLLDVYLDIKGSGETGGASIKKEGR